MDCVEFLIQINASLVEFFFSFYVNIIFCFSILLACKFGMAAEGTVSGVQFLLGCVCHGMHENSDVNVMYFRLLRSQFSVL